MSSPSLTVDRQDRVTGAGENEDTRHVVQFMRRHEPGESLRIASSVLYATVGVIETQGKRTYETSLVRALAGEIHIVARYLLHQRQLEDEGDQLQTGTKRLSAAEVVQWERHLADNEQEEEKTAMRMMETGGKEPSEESSQDSTLDSHRRRRLLAAHDKDFIGEDGRKSDDENCLVAMGRYDSNCSTQDLPMTQLKHQRGKKMRIEHLFEFFSPICDLTVFVNQQLAVSGIFGPHFLV